MREGAYLLHLPGNDYGRPVVVKNAEGGDIIASVHAFDAVANLPAEAELLPLLVITPARLEALRTLDDEGYVLRNDRDHAHRILKEILKELES